MAILNIFKKGKIKEGEAGIKKEKNVKEKEDKVDSQKPESIKKRSGLVKEAKKVKAKGIKEKKKVYSGAYKSLKAPHITEKATDLTKNNQYIFRVWPKTNKIEIKKSVESIYKVKVVAVKVINVSPRKRKLGKVEGVKKGYKKAIVKVKKGQKIEILPR